MVTVYEIGDVITFPFDEDTIKIIKLPGRPYVISCYKNGNLCWLPVAFLRREITGLNDSGCCNDRDRVLRALHSTIKVIGNFWGIPLFKYVEE